ncbi:type II secretion system minor pseudopilin GspK [Vibrio sp. SM6]|uniref:Type II secretion system protein K n=1 Tax=Vibrio agarilyticus TaxID=2726741 RepID=A0A7X8TTG0_9VIBR|nr:type II secretion system minor pseudopilin GspK [Vibrio agarilyticus]NLS14475.1 type II secretion system minor pseudopilin GspK [Vibrio agarilyticus]
MRSHKRSRGVALIIILLLLTIMTTIAGVMSERLFAQFLRGNNQINYQQAYWYAIGIEALAKVGIEQSYKDTDTINLSQPWALKEQTYPLDYGIAKGFIVDKQACFNLNVLASVAPAAGQTERPYLVEVFRTLLEEAGAEPYQAEVIADATWEFVDSDDRVMSQMGVEDATYESFAPAYLAANGLMADASELRAVYQMSGPLMSKLAPLVCALPTNDWRLNVNTIEAAQAPILVAMFAPSLSLSDAQELIEGRPYDGWNDVEDFFAESELGSVDDSKRQQARGYLSVDSAFFELDAQVEVAESRVRIRSLLHSSNREAVDVVRRRFGGFSERVSDRSTE